MSYPLLCQSAELRAKLGLADWAIVDCRFVLAAPEAGYASYLEGHIPGAVYAHLEHDLSGAGATDHGRHPLPSVAEMITLFGRLGIDSKTHVVVYDDSYGMVAARLWWMLRYLGHASVRVLDGGWQAWVSAGLAITSGDEVRSARFFSGRPDRSRLVVLDEVSEAAVLLDAREGPRYRGETEPIDPVAGHVPGAYNHCWRDNLAADGRFLPPAALAERLRYVLGRAPDSHTTHYCGSGVSACHNVLAQEIAGFEAPRLYCGSWSEWCREPGRRVMMGNEPGA